MYFTAKEFLTRMEWRVNNKKKIFTYDNGAHGSQFTTCIFKISKTEYLYFLNVEYTYFFLH